MIELVITNTKNNEQERFEVKLIKTGKLQRAPYQGEAFEELAEHGVIKAGSQTYGTLVCNYKKGEVTYKNNGIEATMKNLECKKLIY
jgi:hypothetical protein